jgi:hypothetical protein
LWNLLVEATVKFTHRPVSLLASLDDFFAKISQDLGITFGIFLPEMAKLIYYVNILTLLLDEYAGGGLSIESLPVLSLHIGIIVDP